MTYFKVDDGFHNHPKVLELPLEAIGFWVLAGSWSGQQLTDGLIPKSLINRLGGTIELAEILVNAGLWVCVENGYQFHEWTAHNKSKDQVIEDRESWRIKKQRQRAYHHSPVESLGESLDESPDLSPGDTLGESHESPGIGIGIGIGTRSLVLNKNREKDFDEFWSVYPRRVGKQAAQKAFKAALAHADAITIIAGAKRLREDPNRLDEFTAHPATWLNQGRWDDDPLPARTSNSRNAGVDDYHRGLLINAAQQDFVLEIGS